MEAFLSKIKILILNVSFVWLYFITSCARSFTHYPTGTINIYQFLKLSNVINSVFVLFLAKLAEVNTLFLIRSAYFPAINTTDDNDITLLVPCF